MELILVAIVAGMIAGISPCVIPVLPIIFFAGATTNTASWRRSLSIVLGLIVSFTVFTLAGAEIISLLHVPQDFLNDAGVVLLVLVGIGFIVPQIGHLLERPFSHIVMTRQPSLSGGGFFIGLALGLVFVPCAGPVLSAITELSAKEHVSLMAVFVTLAFSIGAAVPLMAIAFAGGSLVERVRLLRAKSQLLRQVGGVVLIVMAAGIFFNWFNGLQTSVPGYTNALQNSIEKSPTIHHEIQELSGSKGGSDGKLGNCQSGAPALALCGHAPNFANVTAWFNTPGNKALSIKGLKGKVVLVDFWTYSCINCQRTLPHVEAWYNRYKSDGLVVVGVSTPEFAFEHVVSNVKSASKSLGVDYPVAVDNNYGTWDAYNNEYWPADYLIDASGVVRHVDFGEGNYSQSENFIRKLLVQARPGLKLPPPTSLPNLTPTEPTNPETYVGYERLQYLANSLTPPHDQNATFTYPASLVPGYFAFAGQWDDHEQDATAGKNASLELAYQAQHIYLVMGGTGTVKVSTGNGTAPTTIHVSGVPRLYTLFTSKTTAAGTLTLKASPGVQAYDFTFG